MTRGQMKTLLEAVGEYQERLAAVKRVCEALPAGVPKRRSLLFASAPEARIVVLPGSKYGALELVGPAAARGAGVANTRS